MHRSLATRYLLRATLALFLMSALLKALPVSAAPAYWSVKLARPIANCQRGLGICIDPFGPIDGTALTRAAVEVDRRGVVEGMDPMLHMSFESPLTEKGDTFHIDEDVTLDRQRSLELGYRQVTLLKGAYPIDRTNNPNGEVLIALRTIGITITLDIGRKSMGCTGAGICKVTVGFDFARANSAGGSATLEGSHLSVDFLAEVKGSPRELTIDEDIDLDEQTSLALGAKKVRVLKGTYPVDYSENPNGHVELAVLRVGITVTIDVGRKRYGCTRFGICEITVDIDLRAAGSTPGIVSLDGDMATIDFLSRPKTAAGDEPFVLDDDMVIHRDLAARLGRRSLTLEAGSYAVDYSTNPNGSVTIPVEARGIGVEIWFGRTSLCNPGFGVCRIVIDMRGFSASDARSTKAAASADGHDLMTIDFTERMAFAGDTLHVDEDVVLDEESGAPSGSERLVIRRGAYPVDYSSNPAGSVTVVTALEGAASIATDAAISDAMRPSLFPNPASESAMVRFATTESATVRLEILDAQGCVLLTAINGERLEPGSHERTLDLSTLPAGVYFQRLVAGTSSSLGVIQVVR